MEAPARVGDGINRRVTNYGAGEKLLFWTDGDETKAGRIVLSDYWLRNDGLTCLSRITLEGSRGT